MVTAATAPRTARLVLVTPDGEVVGSLPPLSVPTPWWPDVEPVVRGIRERDGVDVTILRLLEAPPGVHNGGDVTYLAEVAAQPATAEPWPGSLDDHPLRQTFARSGGPATDLAWATAVLIEQGRPPTGRPIQVKTWNLSSLWRIPTDNQAVWLKVVPPFFAHEGPLLERLAGARVPTLLAQADGRSLLMHIPGNDLYAPELSVLLDMVALLVELQHAWTGRTGELLALGLPDWRAPALTAAIADVVERTADELSPEDRAALATFERMLPQRLAEVAACGLDDTLVHGDFWPGNLRGDEHSITLLDWGDSGIGHPLLDQSAFLDRSPSTAAEAISQHWAGLWRSAVPRSDPTRAFALLGPVAAARQAVVYRHFLDCIEPSEHPYHQPDPAACLRRTAALVRDS